VALKWAMAASNESQVMWLVFTFLEASDTKAPKLMLDRSHKSAGPLAVLWLSFYNKT